MLAALALAGLAVQRVAPAEHLTYLGNYYANLSRDPFHPAQDNPIAHRILVPLVSWLLGLSGRSILITDFAGVLLFAALLYVWFRRRGHGPEWALFGVSSIALSMPVLTTLHYGGYPDVFTYLLVFAAWWARKRLWLSCALYLLAMLSHESALFLIPWWLVELAEARCGEASRRTAPWIAGVAVLIVFAGVRVLLERSHPWVAYTVGFYLAPLTKDPLHWFHQAALHAPLGIAAAFNLYWVFAILAATRLIQQGQRGEAVRLLLPIPCALAQLFIAYDVTRMAALAFISVLLGTEYMLRTNAFATKEWAGFLGLGNLLIPQVNVAMGVVDFMHRR